MCRFPGGSSHEVEGAERSGDKRSLEGPKEVGRTVRKKTGDELTMKANSRTDSGAPPGREPATSGDSVRLVRGGWGCWLSYAREWSWEGPV